MRTSMFLRSEARDGGFVLLFPALDFIREVTPLGELKSSRRKLQKLRSLKLKWVLKGIDPQILLDLKDGPRSTKELYSIQEGEEQISDDTIHRHLTKTKSMGFIERLADGMWGLTQNGRDAVQAIDIGMAQIAGQSKFVNVHDYEFGILYVPGTVASQSTVGTLISVALRKTPGPPTGSIP
jgi:hypothetical protein